MRAEVLLNAFADAVVTWNCEEVRWIKGESRPDLPKAVAFAGRGRVVAFRLEP
jgi:hypothetical protein